MASGPEGQGAPGIGWGLVWVAVEAPGAGSASIGCLVVAQTTRSRTPNTPNVLAPLDQYQPPKGLEALVVR